MKPFNGWTRVVVIGVLTLQLCGAAFAQDEKKMNSLGTSLQSPQTSQTGAGRWSTGTAPARTGEADGTETSSSEGIAVRFTGLTAAT
jgi:hypothetical protein